MLPMCVMKSGWLRLDVCQLNGRRNSIATKICRIHADVVYCGTIWNTNQISFRSFWRKVSNYGAISTRGMFIATVNRGG